MGDCPVRADAQAKRRPWGPVSRRAARSPEHRRSLTGQERRILSLLANGLNTKQAGQRLGISEHSTEELVTWALIKIAAGERRVELRSIQSRETEGSRHLR
jgi:DNA-binding CsgD family transcriptional regulator